MAGGGRSGPAPARRGVRGRLSDRGSVDHDLEELTQVMALELAEHGIRVVSVAPGEIATPMTGQDDDDVTAKERSAIPWGRPGDAREIGSVIAFLASPGAAYLTGTSVVVDGGMLLMAAEANRRANA